MTSSGIGRHNSKPILEWDDVELDDTQEGEQQTAATHAEDTPAPVDARSGAPSSTKEKGASPWSAMRKLFKR